jgi:cytochrome c oxidase cbb3-type subunit 3
MLIRKLSYCLLFFSALSVPVSIAQQISSSNHSANVDPDLGRNIYNSTCAGCHGLDGHGSDKAVNISTNAKVRRLSDVQLHAIISSGIPGSGMPAFHNLKERQVRALIGHLRLLQGKSEAPALPGDAKRGREVFFGKGECSTCHTISGEGGFLGPDLSGYGSGTSATAIQGEITKTRRIPSHGYAPAVLITQQGDRMEGLIRNEDNFSVQFQAKDGTFHFFQKSELSGVERLETSLMPTNYAERLSPGELNDLVTYLMTTAANSSPSGISHNKKDDDE